MPTNRSESMRLKSFLDARQHDAKNPYEEFLADPEGFADKAVDKIFERVFAKHSVPPKKAKRSEAINQA